MTGQNKYYIGLARQRGRQIKTPRETIYALNRAIDELGMRALTLAGLKAGGFQNLGELIVAIKSATPLPTIGQKSRSEIEAYLKKNNVQLPTNWRWRP